MMNAGHGRWLVGKPTKLVIKATFRACVQHHQRRSIALRSIVQKLIDELNIDCRIRSVPYPMLDMIARSMERLGRKSAKEPPLTHYGVSKLNFDFTLDILRVHRKN